MKALLEEIDHSLDPLMKRLNSHAYLITGSQVPIVNYFCQKILNTLSPESNIIPDLFNDDLLNGIDLQIINELTIKKDHIDQIKESSKYGPNQNKHLCIWIKRADQMTLAAANGFLKLLEESPNGVRFILSSHNPESCLNTIVSRCQHIKTPLMPTRFWTQYKNIIAKTVEDIDIEAIPDQIFSYWEGHDFSSLDLYQPLESVLNDTWEKYRQFISEFYLKRPLAAQLLVHWIEESWSLFQKTKDTKYLKKCEILNKYFQDHRYNINLKLQLDALTIELKNIHTR